MDSGMLILSWLFYCMEAGVRKKLNELAQEYKGREEITYAIHE